MQLMFMFLKIQGTGICRQLTNDIYNLAEQQVGRRTYSFYFEVGTTKISTIM